MVVLGMGISGLFRGTVSWLRGLIQINVKSLRMVQSQGHDAACLRFRDPFRLPGRGIPAHPEEHMMTYRLHKAGAGRLHLLGVVASLAMGAAPALAEGDAEAGAALYENHCISCHGVEAMGHGPMREVLLVQPTDLTALAAGNDGVFPLLRVAQRIDGRDPLVSHGSSMPVYGDFFETVQQVAVKTAAGQPVMMTQPVADLVAYLESLQGQ